MAAHGPHGLPAALVAGARVPPSGDAPPDGDFAKLLEAASRPSAHRMHVDPTLAAMVTPDTRSFGIARRPVRGSPGGGRDTPGQARAHAHADAVTSGNPSHSGMSGDSGDWGRRDTLPAREPASSSGPRPGSAAGRRTPWAQRPLRDRVVAVLFGAAMLWILGGFVTALLASPADALGGLLVLAAASFFVLRAWARGRRTRPTPDA